MKQKKPKYNCENICAQIVKGADIDAVRWSLRGKGPDAMSALSAILRIEGALFKHYIKTGKFKNFTERELKQIAGTDGIEVARKVIENLLKVGWTPGDHVRNTIRAAKAKCGISIYCYEPGR